MGQPKIELPSSPFTNGPAVARRTDPDTSWWAAMSVLNIRETQAKMYALLRSDGPLTDEEVFARYTNRWGKITPSGCRTRRAELVDIGLVIDAKDDGTTEAGRACARWRAISIDEWKAIQTGQPRLI